MPRQRNRTEQYLHERVQGLFAANPDPILFEIALRALVEEVATACGLFIAEMHSTEMLASWVGRFLDKLNAVKNGIPQEIRIGPAPVPKEMPPAPPEPATPVAPQAGLSPRYQARRERAGALYLSGAEIIIAREALGLYQWQLGALVGKSRSSIKRLEHGQRIATIGEYRDLRKVLNLPLEKPIHD